jgi:hypothetical protein
VVAARIAGEFYFTTEGAAAPEKVKTSLCLSYHPQSPLAQEEVMKLARDSRPSQATYLTRRAHQQVSGSCQRRAVPLIEQAEALLPPVDGQHRRRAMPSWAPLPVRQRNLTFRGAAFLCADLQITDPRADHAQYLASWLAVLKSDKKAIFTAASKASEAAAFLAAL